MRVFDRMAKHRPQGSEGIIGRAATLPPRQDAVDEGFYLFPRHRADILPPKGRQEVEPKSILIYVHG